jgi:hypothetical protein
MRLAIPVVVALMTACATSAPAPVLAPATPRAPRPPVAAVRYRRLAWSPEFRHRDWLDEVHIPSLGVAFNLETQTDSASETLEFFPKLNAFRATGPVGYSEDLYGKVPGKLELTPIEVPADIADAVAEHARIVAALEASARALGTRVDATLLLPPVVGSPRWKPPKTE